MNASREMPKYECHKKVWALKIAGIVGDPGRDANGAERIFDLTPESKASIMIQSFPSTKNDLVKY